MTDSLPSCFFYIEVCRKPEELFLPIMLKNTRKSASLQAHYGYMRGGSVLLHSTVYIT